MNKNTANRSTRACSTKSTLCAALMAACLAGTSLAQGTVRVSLSPVGSQGNMNSFWGAVSAGGTHVAFESFASNLVIGDLNGHLPDIFLKTVQTGSLVMVSVDSAGGPANSGSIAPSLSADARYVAFESLASNLVPGDTNATRDIFVHDSVTGATLRASVNSAGVQASDASYFSALSADGRFVAFESDAADLVAGDTNGVRDVFVHDLQTGATVRASVDGLGLEADAACTSPAISADGRFVAWVSAATNLVLGDTNGQPDVFVKDFLTGATTRVSVDSAGTQGDLASNSPTLSADGRFVAFTSDAHALVASDTNGVSDVFVHDRLTGATTRVSVDSTGVQGNGASLTVGGAQISADGRYVTFESWASNLVAGDTNGSVDCFVHDRLSGNTTRVSVTAAGAQSSGNAHYPAISPEGRFVVFDSSSANLVPGDNNLYMDVFLRDRGPEAAVPFCFGDGSGAACPCGNSSPVGAGAGCLHSLGTGGKLNASGAASLMSDTLVLLGTQMPSAPALYFQGTTQNAGGAGVVFGDGLRCAAGTVVRLGTVTNVNGTSHYPAAGNPIISLRGLVGAPGDRTYQVWYRNAAAFCQPATFNLTNGVQVTWFP